MVAVGVRDDPKINTVIMLAYELASVFAVTKVIASAVNHDQLTLGCFWQIAHALTWSARGIL